MFVDPHWGFVRVLLWSRLIFLSCAKETGSCCIAYWIQLRVGEAQMAVLWTVLSVLAGLLLGEAQRTNTFLLKIPLRSELFKQANFYVPENNLQLDPTGSTLLTCTCGPCSTSRLLSLRLMDSWLVSPSLAPLALFSFFLGSLCFLAAFCLPLFS